MGGGRAGRKELDREITLQMAVKQGRPAKKLVAAGSKSNLAADWLAGECRRDVRGAIDDAKLIAVETSIVVYRQRFDVSRWQYEGLRQGIEDIGRAIGAG